MMRSIIAPPPRSHSGAPTFNYFTMKILINSLIFLGISATASNAAITLVDSFFATDAGDASSFTVDGSGLDLTGASKVVITTAGEADGNATGLEYSSITFGGVGLTQAITGAGGQGRASIWYLDLDGVSLTGTDFGLTVSGGGVQEGLGFSAFSLSGTVSGVSATVSGNTPTLTTPTDGEFAVGSYARNGNLSGTMIDPPLTQLYNFNGDGFTAASGSALLGAAGDYNLTSTNLNGSGDFVVASFEAVPETSAALLCLVSGLFLIIRRRRG